MLKAWLMTLPVLVPVLVFYWLADPFKVLRHDRQFYDPSSNMNVGLNKGMVTVTNYERQLQKGNQYNAFIFGSSITCYYNADEWASYLKGDSISPYHFDSSSESIQQMAEKVKYLQRTGAPIKHALIVLDPLIMGRETDDSPMSISPPQLSANPLHWLKYHYTFLRASTNADFLKSWVPAQLSGTPYFLGRNPVFEVQPIAYDEKLNQESLPAWDEWIAKNPDEFYAQHPLIASPTATTVSQMVITPEKAAGLREIADIFREQATDYQIIIGPNRRKVVLNPVDKKTLDAIFGSERVHDFSRALFNDLENDSLLYDNTHYRPEYASKLMRLVYSPLKESNDK